MRLSSFCSLRDPLLRFLAQDRLCQPVAFAGENADVRVVDQTVNEGCGKAVVSKDGVPLRELQIGRNHQIAPLLEMTDRKRCDKTERGNKTRNRKREKRARRHGTMTHSNQEP